MATGSALPLAGGKGAGNWPPSKDLGSYSSLPANLSGEELAVMSNGGSIYGSWRDSVPNRSGSAPPSMEGSLAALGHLIGQQSGSLEATLGNLGTGADGLKFKDPAFFERYGSKINMKPRLPPPIFSRESHHSVNWFGKARESKPFSLDDSSSSGRSLFRRLSALSTHKEEPEDDRPPRLEPCSAEGAHCDSAQSTSNLGSHSSNILDLLQENFPQTTALRDNSSDPANTNPCDGINSSKNSPLDVVKSLELDGFPQDTHQWSPRPIGSPLRNTLNSNSLSTSSRPASSCSDHNTVIQASQQGNPSMNIKPGGAVGVMLDSVDSSMKNLKISSDNQGNSHVMQQSHNNALMQNGPSHVLHTDPLQMIPQGINLPHIPFLDNFALAHMKLHSSQLGMTAPFYTPSSFGSPYCENFQSPTVWAPPFGIDGYDLHGPFLPPAITNFAQQLPLMTPFGTPLTTNFSGRLAGFPSAGNLAAGTEYSHPYKIYEQLGVAMPPSIPDPSLIHYFQQPYMHQYGGGNPYGLMGPSTNFVGNPAGLFGSQKVLSETIHQSEKRFQPPITGASSSHTLRNGGNSVVNYQSTSPYIGIQTPYPANTMFCGQPLSGTHPHGRTDDAMAFQSPSKNMSTSSGVRGHQVREKSNDPKVHSFVEELKSNRTHRVELSEIKGHIMEYSSDQSGSRFIQQKLENCTTEEKALAFAEVLPHASSLMIDVFGNYVIQKFFELGSPEQRRDLASMLVGQVLPLSLQMYGCRVIQKALEAIELDQKIDLVRELDGHVLRCVHDQNGNHVIQKCIECLPMEHIGFIISSFQDQVANLSTHPYGCRVIQRILEHCSNDSEGKSITDEILESVCILAQDQYGNYVTQNVLERGKSHVRSQIISKLVGQVVSLSQNKYASNVIEKCFQHGDVAERDLLIKEILEQTEGNNYLLVMMKDRFANYVVQKMLETCNELQREALLSRITCHLQALRKFTYGKHIVSRVEQLSSDGAVQSES